MPLPTSKRNQIINKIITLIQDIKLANGYNTNLAVDGIITRDLAAVQNADRNRLPFVTIMFNNMTWEAHTANQSERVLETVTIDMYTIVPADSSDPYEELDKVLQDIEIAIFQGGPTNTPSQFDKVSLQGLSFVEDTQKQSFFNDQGIMVLEDNVAWGRLTLTVEYITDLLDP